MDVYTHILPVLQMVEDIFQNQDQMFWMYTLCGEKLYLTSQMRTLIELEEEEHPLTLQTFFSNAFGRDRLEGLKLLTALMEQDADDVDLEFRMMGKDKSLANWHMKGHRFRASDRCEDTREDYYAGVMIHKKAADHFRHQKEAAYWDVITELPNRVMFNYKAAVALEQARETGRNCGILSIDIDHFKKINDLYGHALGDLVLKTISRHLDTSLGAGSLLARPGGDEYLVLLENLDGPDALTQRMLSIQNAFIEPIFMEEYSFQISISMGAVMYPEDGTTLDELVKHADMALHLAKDSGRGRGVRYDSLVGESTVRKNQLSHRMPGALACGEFSVHFQPLMTLRTEEICSAEALLRWNSPEFGQISPGEFIPIAEETGFIKILGAWVLENVVKQINEWNRTFCRMIPIAINLSAIQLDEDHLCQYILKLINQYSVLPEQIILEITESALLGSYQATCEKLRILRTAGFQVALDDFGTGYSSLSQLKSLPIDILKIDKSFIDRLGMDHTEDAIIRTIINLAHILNLEAVAEGVETLVQKELLSVMGCNKIQGYWFGKPLELSQFASTWL